MYFYERGLEEYCSRSVEYARGSRKRVSKQSCILVPQSYIVQRVVSQFIALH